MNDQIVLRRIEERSAIIIKAGARGVQSFAAYPYGDRRRRPISWIDHAMLRRMLADGVIEKTDLGYEVVSSVRRRLKAGRGAGAHAGQHRDMEDAQISNEQGVFRPVKRNKNSKSVLRRLALTDGGEGRSYLDDSEIEAGERLSFDYARSLLGLSITQNFENVGGGGEKYTSGRGPEGASIAIIDAQKRVREALAYVGPGLDKALTSICCQEMGLEEMERAQGWVRRSGKTVLKLALQRLATFYGTRTGLH